ncbi:thioesterase domain-containing protein, partial [Aquimarina sp. D1M17]|uniref:thioesterase domain-containing protein n=1 Tax=Aquimarina acroporae TaxID=2937283 RepID=UPI0020BFD2BC
LKQLPEYDGIEKEKYVAPGNNMQEELVVIWSDILTIKKDRISIISNFFNLGGNSLLAMTLRNRVNKKFNIELPLAEIFLHPNIRLLSERIMNWKATEEQDKVIHPINNGSGENLFIIHDGSGELEGYLELSTKINKYKCYGIRFGQFNDILESPSIEQIASNYINEIKTIQKTGPYHILGWSLGGVIAAEITAQLEAQGEKVENLIIIDSALQFEKTLENQIIDISSEIELAKSKFDIPEIEEQNFDSINEVWNYISDSKKFLQTPLEDIRNMVPEMIQLLIPDFLDKNAQEIMEATNKIRLLIAASDRYFVNNPINANTLYISPNQSQVNIDREKQQHLFRNSNTITLPGDHFSIMRSPVVNELSRTVNEHLEVNVLATHI